MTVGNSPLQTKKTNVRYRAWKVMRIFPRGFTVEEILEIVTDGTDTNARNTLNGYLNGLERMEIVRRQQRGPKATVYWNVIKDVGSKAPVVSNAPKVTKSTSKEPLALTLQRPTRGDVIDVDAVVLG